MFQAQIGQKVRAYDFNEAMHATHCADFIEGIVTDIQGDMITATMTARIFDGVDVIEEFEDKTFKTAQNGAMWLDDTAGPRIFPV